MMTFTRTALLLAALAAAPLTLPAQAQQAGANQGAAEPDDERIARFKDRLKITPEQVQELRPLFRWDTGRMREINEKYRGKTAPEEKQERLKEFVAAKKEYDTRLKAILTDDQWAELQKMRKERLEQFRAQKKSRRK